MGNLLIMGLLIISGDSICNREGWTDDGSLWSTRLQSEKSRHWKKFKSGTFFSKFNSISSSWKTVLKK